jgi:hypothetical protein
LCAVSTLGQSPPTTYPASQPAGETITAARQRLAHIKSRDRSDSDRALFVALDFVLAIGSGDSRKLGPLIDAVGYQALPLAGELPEKPDKPLPPSAIEKSLLSLPKADLGVLPASCAAIMPRAALRERFPAIATWMLPPDLAVVFRPIAKSPIPSWLTQEACVVVRIRGERATIIGGNLLQALTTAAENAAPPAEEK